MDTTYIFLGLAGIVAVALVYFVWLRKQAPPEEIEAAAPAKQVPKPAPKADASAAKSAEKPKPVDKAPPRAEKPAEVTEKPADAPNEDKADVAPASPAPSTAGPEQLGLFGAPKADVAPASPTPEPLLPRPALPEAPKGARLPVKLDLFGLRLSPQVEVAFSLAVHEAARRRHEYVDVGHVLYALLLDEEAAEVLRHAGGDTTAIKTKLEKLLDDDVSPLPADADAWPSLSPGLRRIMVRAVAEMQGAGNREVKSANVLVAVVAKGGPAVAMMEAQGITLFGVMDAAAAKAAAELTPADP